MDVVPYDSWGRIDRIEVQISLVLRIWLVISAF